MVKRNILVTGSLPPPVGGVSIFLHYFYSAADSVPTVTLSPFGFTKLISSNYGVIHINASSPFKRFLYVVLGKIFGKKVFFVKHGGLLSLDNIFVKVSLRLADGVFCLNKQVLDQVKGKNIGCLQHSTIFRENVKELVDHYPRNISAHGDKCRLLFYLNNDRKIDGIETYGGSFLVSCLDLLEHDFDITIVDLSGAYKDEFASYTNVLYLDQAQDFKALLIQSDIYVRPTSSDGMSVAILEAGLLGVKCLASDAVERPAFVSTYRLGDKSDFISALHRLKDKKSSEIRAVTLSSVEEVFDFMFRGNLRG